METLKSFSSKVILWIWLFLAVGVQSIAQNKGVNIPLNSQQVIYGKIVDEKGEPLIAQVQVWHYPLTPVVFSFGESKQGERTDNLINMSYSTEKGYFSIRVPADTIALIVSKGPEWSLEKKIFVINPKEFNGIEYNITMKRLYNLSKLGWYPGDVHHHSIFSDGNQTPSEIAHAMKGVGLSWGILTDHNIGTQFSEWIGNKSIDFIPIKGCEITTEPSEIAKEKGYGHYNQSFISKIDVKYPLNPLIWERALFDNHQDVQDVINKTHNQNGFIAINHSFQNWDWAGRFKSWGKVNNFDAIEVWNGEPPHSFTVNDWDTNHININTWSLHAWFSYLNEGNKISGIAGSDCHDIFGKSSYPKGEYYWTSTTGNPRTYALCDSLSEKNIKNAMERGELFLTSGFGPLLLVDFNGNKPGDIIRIKENEKIKLTFEVLSNQKLLKSDTGVRIIYNGNIIQSISTDTTFTLKKEIELIVEKDGWVLVEAFGTWPQYAITNPIFIDFPPYGDCVSKEWKDPKEAEIWNTFMDHSSIELPNGPSDWRDTSDSSNNLNKSKTKTIK
ncbi:MAG: CehA/McbA family metallohydrolase [Melioribacteraceae bacterium]